MLHQRLWSAVTVVVSMPTSRYHPEASCPALSGSGYPMLRLFVKVTFAPFEPQPGARGAQPRSNIVVPYPMFVLFSRVSELPFFIWNAHWLPAARQLSPTSSVIQPVGLFGKDADEVNT